MQEQEPWMSLLVLSSCQVHAIPHLKILSKSWPLPLQTFLLAPLLLTFIILVLKNLSSPAHVTRAVWLKPLFPQHEQRKLLVTSLEAVEAAPMQAEKKQKSSQSEKQSGKVKSGWRLTPANFLYLEKVWACLSMPQAQVFPLQEEACFDVSLGGTGWWDGSEGSEATGPPGTWSHLSFPKIVFSTGSSNWKSLWAQGSFSLKEIRETRDLVTEAFKHWTESTKWMKSFQKGDLLCSFYIIVGGENSALHGSLKQNFALHLVFQMMQGKHFLV